MVQTACLHLLPVQGAQGLTSQESPDLEAFKMDLDESQEKRASQEIWSVVKNEQKSILKHKFITVSWGKQNQNQNHII